LIAYSKLLREWEARPASPIYRSITFIDDHLVLGADTRLAKLRKNRSLDFDIGGQEERILALLSVAYWYPIPMSVLLSLGGAARACGRGEKALAYIYLAHTRLPKFDRGDQEPCRLFLADRLLSAGVDAVELLEGLGIDTGFIRLLKASADDLRHPGWPAGTPDGLGGKFRPRDDDAAGSEDTSEPALPVATPVADFSGGFHDAVVTAWLLYFQKTGIPAIPGLGIRIIGSNSSIIGYLDIIVNAPQLGGLAVIEVKTGDDPPLTPMQRAYIPVLQVGGHIYSTDPRLAQLGLAPGVPFPPMPVYILYAPGPGLPYGAQKLPPPEYQK
jgi:hypothetical protein